ncbi:hypothetical protein [Micromonospora sp. WMMD998]|uniref:hypothetical protein n=1 Tax=Micromonospora sp. WMMD998 TaxID=3016092 RepID=UPI002499E509|nr:hypothetical protein [Micromonospora sp. WMMD998]WFE41927.1 hypothetical protein O7619_27165 [Micromonospora sp. WMMD998]
MSKVEITAQPGGRSTIVVDGADISAGVGAYVLYDSAREGTPTLEITVPVVEATTLAGEAQVIISDGAAETLVALGWVPPTDAQPMREALDRVGFEVGLWQAGVYAGERAPTPADFARNVVQAFGRKPPAVELPQHRAFLAGRGGAA